MNIKSKYNPSEVEDKWYQYWIREKYFNSTPDEREAYTIVIPPPNVTGVLHMGHILNNTIQDILIRRARMLGKNACWVPGTDHASIATEAKVVNLLAEQGINKRDIGREAFLEHAWVWKEKHDGIITGQLKKLGASCDWNRSRFTMDEGLSNSVIQSFKMLYAEGLIYRGARMINWDPKARTALSDEEVTRKEVRSNLYYVKYPIKDSDEFITIATTRPETILGDTAVCVNPKDTRYSKLKNRTVIIPIVDREVPLIFDDYVDMEFGTGALKITPAHDINDYEIGLKHHLAIVDTLNEDGTMSEAAGHYIGEDRFVVRKKIVKELERLGRIEKVEEITNNVGYSERNPDTVVEPRISTQWFLKMEDIVKPALKAVKDGDIKVFPDKFIKNYRNWLENIKDWCISRQLWWGHRIPAWYNNDGQFVIADTAVEAVEEFKKIGITVSTTEVRQDEDVLDTWFSSWLWPFSVFNWDQDSENADLKYYYPTNDLVTGHDIIFFWVARMIMAGYHFMGKKPFSNVYFTGMVRDKQGRKMSKSLGNSPDALSLIEEYGADGVRVGMMLCAPAGNDLPFDDALCLQGRNFANKIWNAFRLVKGWEVSDSEKMTESATAAHIWFESKLNDTLINLEVAFKQFRISEALMMTYKLIWDDFCSWYLEMVKPNYESPIDRESYDKIVDFFDRLLRVVHPFMPFISEEIWQELKERKSGESIVIAEWPAVKNVDAKVLSEMTFTQELITAIRQIRNEQNIPQKEKITLQHFEGDLKFLPAVVKKLSNTEEILAVEQKPVGGKSFVIDNSEFFIPLSSNLNVEDEKARILTELEYTKGFLKMVEKKLGNERFVQNAPKEVVETEQKKKADAEERMKILTSQLDSL